jgi:hypothetical protein
VGAPVQILKNLLNPGSASLTAVVPSEKPIEAKVGKFLPWVGWTRLEVPRPVSCSRRPMDIEKPHFLS